MAKKRTTHAKGKAAAKSKPARAPRAKRTPSVAAETPTPSAAESSAAATRYTESVVERGEAVPAGQPLPPGATHEIVGHDEKGAPVLKRRRFSAR